MNKEEDDMERYTRPAGRGGVLCPTERHGSGAGAARRPLRTWPADWRRSSSPSPSVWRS
ncbi:MAG: hypothetical protein ACLUJG_01555 [Lawsonibacter sp.]